MPFPVAITGGQQTQLRQKFQRFKQFLAVTPFEIVWQAEVDENLTATAYDQFDWTNESGSYGGFADVREGMTVFITSSAGSVESDFKNPVLRGRARTDPDATTFFINKLGDNIDDTMYVTVIYDYDLHERNQETDVDGEWFKDSDIPYTALPPYVSDGLQSTYIDYSGDATVTIEFAPTISALTDGATISSLLWDVDDGSITVGTTTTNDITVEFPGAVTNEWRWVRLEFTDDNGTSYYFVFQVFTVDITDTANSDVLVMLGSNGATVQGNWIEGFSSAKLANEDVSGILPNTRCTLFSVGWYGGTTTPIVTNIMLIGRLRAEITSQNTNLDTARRSTTNFSLEGFGQQLGALPVPPLGIIDTDSPTKFTEVTDPTPRRAIMYVLIWHSTFASLCAVQFDSDVDDYVDKNFFMDNTSSMLNLVNQQARYIQAQMTFAASGEAAVNREANYIPTVDRGGIPAIFLALSIDRASWEIDIDPKDRVSLVETGATSYDTSSKTRIPYLGRSPVQGLGSGHEPERLDGILLKADLSGSDAQNALQSITGNHLTNMNPKPVLRVTWAGAGGYWWITPVQWHVYRFIVDAGENIRGVGYDSGDDWLCTSVSHTHNNEDGTKVVVAIFELVSLPGRAGRYAGQIIIDAPTGEAQVYTGSVYNGDPDNPLVNYPDNDPGFELGAYPTSSASGPVEDALNEPAPLGAQTLNVPMWVGNVVSTTNDSENGELYTITVEGDGVVLEPTSWAITWRFALSNGKWDPITATDGDVGGAWIDGVGWIATLAPPGNINTMIAMSRVFGANTTLTDAQADYDLDNSGDWDGASPLNAITIFPDNTEAGAITLVSTSADTDPTDTDKTLVYAGSQVVNDVDALEVQIHSARDFGHVEQGDVTILSIFAAGIGDPPFGLGQGERGDAFYRGYDTDDGVSLYAAGSGLLINGSTPTNIPVFSSVHSYSLQVTGDGNPISFKFQDSDYSDNDRVPLVVTVTGPGMNPEVLP